MPLKTKNEITESVAQRLRKRTADSIKWLKKKIRRGEKKGKAVSQPKMGMMYMFTYDAKHKDTLPYFDAQPLIFVVDMGSKGFTGINLHYIPPKLRIILLNRLKGLATGKGDKRALQMTYNTLKGASKYKFFQPAFKQYLWGHVRSKFLHIPFEEWDNAITLPTAKWQGASKSKVYKDSLDKI